MRIIYFGSSEFSGKILEGLKDSGDEIVRVVTQPDRRKGRHLVLSPPPVKVVAQASGLTIFQPENVNTAEVEERLKSLEPHLFIVAGYGQILKETLLKIPKLYPINVHDSLLPKYRGAAPINSALLNGETITGITIFKMTKDMDAGDILLSESLPIYIDDNFATLSERLSKLGLELLLVALEMIRTGKASFIPQDEKFISFAPKLKKEDGLVDWRLTAPQLHNRIKALIPWPCCYTYLEGKLIKLWSSKLGEYPSAAVGEPGAILDVNKEDGIKVMTGDGELIIRELQPEGKRRMTVEEFIAGHRVSQGMKFIS